MTATAQARRFVRSALALAVAGALGTAGAQQAAPAGETKPPAEADVALPTIVVTAQKRKEKLQDVPIAVTAFDSRDLEKIEAGDMRDIAIRTPGFTMTLFNVGEPQYSIRGVGSTSDSAAGEASVAVFVDEIFIGRPAGANFGFLDLERIEVLRGPQGTLFGRNTSGGAISVTTARPSHTPSSKFYASYGNYNAVEASGVINAPLNERVAARLSLGYRDHGGYSHHILTGADLDGGSNASARFQLLIDASSATSILLRADAASDRGDGLARVPFPVFPTTATSALIRALYPEDTNLRLAYSDPASFQNRDVHGASAHIEHELGFGTLASISAYRRTKLAQLEDLSVLPPPWVLVSLDRVDETARQFSQELRLASSPGREFTWVAGLYYFTESVVRDESFYTRFSLVPPAGGNVLFNQDVSNKSSAIFGQLDYPVARDLNLSVGLRQTHDYKRADQAAINLDAADATPGIPLFPGQPYHIVASKSWNALTGKFGLDYRMDRDKLLYASVSRGYKSGMFPSQNNSIQSVAVPLEPERVWNYEVGVKTEWLDRRLRLNANAFALDYKDLQQFNLTPQLVLVAFSVDAKIKGAEIEMLAAPAKWLMLGANASYLDTRVTNGVFAGFNLNGNRLARSPQTTCNIFGEASTEVAGGMLSARVDYARKDRFYTDAANSATNLVPAYSLVDARLAYAPRGSGLEFSIWGKNLSNTLYQSHVIAFLGNGFSLFAPPRTVGASLSWNFGGGR